MSDMIGKFQLTDMNDIVRLAKPVLKDGRSVKFIVVGNSMNPIFINNRDKVIVSMAEKVKKDKKPNIFKRFGGFLKEVKVETFKRIVWPTRKQVINNTIIVLVTLAVVGVFVWLIDFLFTNVLQFALDNLSGILG